MQECWYVGSSLRIISPLHWSPGGIVTNGDWAGLGPGDGINNLGSNSVVDLEIPCSWVSTRQVSGSALVDPCLGLDAWCDIGSWGIIVGVGVGVGPVPVYLTSVGKTERIESNVGSLSGSETSAVLWSNFDSWVHTCISIQNTARTFCSIANLSRGRDWFNNWCRVTLSGTAIDCGQVKGSSVGLVELEVVELFEVNLLSVKLKSSWCSDVLLTNAVVDWNLHASNAAPLNWSGKVTNLDGVIDTEINHWAS